MPVLAYAATAVPSTMDGGGVLFDTKQPAHVAALMQAILDDEALVDRILETQDAALTRLEAQDFDGTLLRFVREVLDGPPGVAPEVAFDFWDQFELQEQLEEVRQYRPSALRALPKVESASADESALRALPKQFAFAEPLNQAGSATAESEPGPRNPEPGL